MLNLPRPSSRPSPRPRIAAGRSARRPIRHPQCNPGRQRGFTLMELVIGLVVLAIALTLVTRLLGPLHESSGYVWQQVRAAELAQSVLGDIMARSFDENASRGGGEQRCDEFGATACAASLPACPPSGLTSLSEEALMADWDDVDDYHCLRVDAGSLTGLLGSQASRYAGYQLAVTVSYAGTAAGLGAGTANNRRAKRIDLVVTAPDGTALSFSSLKGNW